MERAIWTLAYRKPTASSIKRIKLGLTWREARALADRLTETGRSTYITTSASYEANLPAELAGELAAGRCTEDYLTSMLEDVGNILVDSGKRIRVFETGTLAELGLNWDDVEAAIEQVKAGQDRFNVQVTADKARRRSAEVFTELESEQAAEQAAESAPVELCDAEGPTESEPCVRPAVATAYVPGEWGWDVEGRYCQEHAEHYASVVPEGRVVWPDGTETLPDPAVLAAAIDRAQDLDDIPPQPVQTAGTARTDHRGSKDGRRAARRLQRASRRANRRR